MKIWLAERTWTSAIFSLATKMSLIGLSSRTMRPVPADSVMLLLGRTAVDWAAARIGSAVETLAMRTAATALPSEMRLVRFVVRVIYLAPTGTTVTLLPRATRTTGPVGWTTTVVWPDPEFEPLA